LSLLQIHFATEYSPFQVKLRIGRSWKLVWVKGGASGRVPLQEGILTPAACVTTPPALRERKESTRITCEHSEAYHGLVRIEPGRRFHLARRLQNLITREVHSGDR
jgi:hypothetical protein